jgi:hypothetical protein
MPHYLILLAALAADCPPYTKGATGGDYYNPEDAKGLTVVETFHFGPKVEALQHGKSGALGSDIAYTLEHFPNHPRALHTAECYFERAIAFVPADGAARALFGAYLLSLGRDDDAIEQLQAAVRVQPGNAAAWYNLGLAQVRRKEWPAALDAAHKAYGLGFPLPGLRQKLKAAREWRDPESLDPVVAH